MKESLKAIISGDAMIDSKSFESAWNEYFPEYKNQFNSKNWESDWDRLQYRRLEVEKSGPEIENVPDVILENGKNANVLTGLFVPISSKVYDAMPNLRIVGVSRAGTENVNIEEATKRGILVFNVMGRNAHAVSDFTVGMILAEARNIARAHHAIKEGTWQKTFANDGNIMELRGKNIGIVGLGHIGKLLVKKLSGFDVNISVYDPFLKDDVFKELGVKKVELDELMSTSDFITLNARLTDENKGMIGKKEIALMKKTSIIINTGRAGLLDEDALIEALKNKDIAGAALDVFSTEPIEKDNELLNLDNVTLTTHIAGTTTDALNNSPYMLMEDISNFIKGEKAKFIVNPEVLENEDFRNWLNKVR